MEEINQETNRERETRQSLTPLIIAILIGAWFIAIGIVVAGWLIAQKMVVTGTSSNTGSKKLDNSSAINTGVSSGNFSIPTNLPAQGKPDAKVVVVEFADFQCPFCREWQELIYPKLKSEYIDTGKVKFIFWDFAFLGDESFYAAEAAKCAQEQNKFWEFHDSLYENQKSENEGGFSQDKLISYGSTVGLNISTFKDCIDSRKYKDEVESMTNLASTSYGVNSTPTVFINKTKIEGVPKYDEYVKIINAELSK